MKKLMTSAIILLPLLLLAIMLVSGAIVSMMAHVYVESVEFVQGDTLVLIMSDEENPPTEQLAVNVFPLKAENRDVVFSVDNRNIASVDENGIVTAKFYGETYISVVSSENKAASARRKLIVTDTSVHEIAINEGYAADMYEDDTQQLSVTIYPQEAINQSVTWSSSDENILSVSADGTVTSKGAGKAMITAISSDNGEVQASVEITGHTKITDIEVDQTLVVTSLTESEFPQVTPVPADADITLTFKTDNSDIATVDAYGNIRFKKEGRVTVTVTATDFGNRTVEKKKEYTSTDGYYLPPLFTQKEYTVDYDEYKDEDKALPIPFAKTLEGSYREFISVKYSVDNVLSFAEEAREFHFAAPMPIGTRTLTATVKARVYEVETGTLVDYEDGFTLNVLRNAKKVAVTYGGTEDVAAITTSKSTFKFTLAEEESGTAAASVVVEPANHTNAIEYALTDGQDTAQISDAGVLTFTKAGSVTVKILLIAADGGGSITAEKELIVTYAPFDATEKKVDITDEAGNQKLILTMEDETDRQEGILYFAEPAGATVTYVVTDGEEVIELEEKNGAWHIVPQMGGFATVTVSVIPKETSARASGKTYTVDVYVDCPVEIGLLKITLGDRLCEGDTYGTSSKNVAYSLNIKDERGFMEGKTLYVKYSSENETASEGATVLSGSISFGAELSSLNVTFGVKYGERAKQFGVEDKSLEGAVRSVTILRDAESVTVSYESVQTTKIILKQKTFTFGTQAVVTVFPANHQNTLAYVLENDNGIATLADGKLTFTGKGSVTVKLELHGVGDAVTVRKEITVIYAPLESNEKEINVSGSSQTQKVLLSKGETQDTGVIYYTEPEGATVKYEVKGENGVVTVESDNGVYHITPKKGGFATVEITATKDDNVQKYTIEIYVDVPVNESNLAIQLNGAPCTASFGTKETSVPFTVTFTGADGAMAGKTLYLRYGSENRTANDGERSLSGDIAFGESLSSLNVTFGVEYSDRAKEFGVQDKSLDGAVQSVTILRDAREVEASYKGTPVERIQISRKELTFITETSGDASVVAVKAIPANHTNTLAYVLVNGEGIATLEGGKLTFTSEGSVTVKIELRGVNNAVTVEKEITVTYTAAKVGEKTIEVSDANAAQKVVLEMLGGGNVDTGRIDFTEPADTTVTYTIEKGDDIISLDDHQHSITPLKGGFATVKITVTPQAEGGKKEYTIDVYVNRPVETKDFSVQFNDTPCTDKFGTAGKSVSFKVTFNGADGAMQGKKFYVSYGGKEQVSEMVGASTFEGTIDFGAELGTLAVTFGVKYDEATWSGFDLESDSLHSDDMIGTSARTILRNAESVTVSYESVQTTKIILKQSTFTFGTQAVVTVLPANHQNTLAYVLENEDGTATLAGNKLTFQKAGSVTVKLELRGVGGAVTVQKAITVIYAPLESSEKEINVSEGSQTQKVLLGMGNKQDTGVIYYTEPEGAEVQYQVKDASGVVTVENKNGVRRITPKKGGFATVEITATKDGDIQTYTIEIYVDVPVNESEFEIRLGGAPCAAFFGTTETSVPFTVTFTGTDGAMAGKALYVKYGDAEKESGQPGATTFTGTIDFGAGLGTLTVTFGVKYAESAKGYGAESALASVTREIGRNATDISISYGEVHTTNIQTSQAQIDFRGAGSGGQFANVTVLPANHADTFSYSLVDGSSVAAISPQGKLIFTKAGVATVKIALLDKNGTETLSKQIAVTYAPVGQNKKIELTEGATEKHTLYFSSDDKAGNRNGAIYFTNAEGTEVEYAVTSGNDVVKLGQVNGLWQIMPQKGGFATVTVTETQVSGISARGVRAYAARETKIYTIETYVDMPVSEGDFEVEFNGNVCADSFRTSLGSVSYSVTVSNREGSTAGKKLYATFNGTKSEAEPHILTHSGTISFAGKTSIVITFGVEYSDEAKAFGAQDGIATITRTVTTSNGILDEAPTVTYQGGGKLQAAGTALTFANIGEQIILTVSKPFSPADFDLSANKPSIEGTVYVGVSISADGSQITLTAQAVCQGQQMLLSIGGKTFTLNVTVRALAEELTVTCGKTAMANGPYKTLLDALTFNVKIADRADGQPISNSGIQYSLNGSEWNDVEGGNVEIQVSLLTDNGTLRFRSADEGASMEFRLEKVSLGDFGLEFSVQTSSSGKTVLGKVESFEAASAVSYSIPSDVQGALTIAITLKDDDLLGGFGTNEEFGKMISVTLPTPTEWETSYESARGVIIISGDFSGVYSKALSISDGSHTLTVNLSHTFLASVEFTGFDSKKPEDNYKGYQQVRVFAKQSYYDGAKVDYFRIPLVALEDLVQKTPADPTLLTWKLTRYTGNEAKETVASQTGNKVTYGGAEYTIGQSGAEYVLKDASGIIVSGQSGKNAKNITWVDVYSEKDAGIARIYFGNFGGLSESDVQNDYFGNFGEQDGWKKKTPEGADKYDGSNRIFTPSANAYSFLRVEAGDGAVGGKNCHFNFNVLQDANLVNVFDVAGYSANQFIVLHHDLYGPGERTDAEEKYVMSSYGTVDGSDVSNIGGSKKIFGNGYQVNYQAFNQYLIDIKTNVGTLTVGNTYNAVILGANPDDERAIDQDHLKVRLNKNQGDDTYLYYCLVKDFRQSFRLNGANKVGYIKNCVFRNASKEALCINNENAKLYVENVVMDSVKVAMLTAQKNTYYLKGSIDILNYIGKTEAIKTFAGEDIPDGVINLFSNAFEKKIDTIEQYMEFFGKEGGKNELDDSKYVNLCVVNKGDKSFKDANTLYHYFWDEKSQKYVQEQADAAATNSGALRTVITSKSQNLLVYEVPGFSGMTYDSLNTVDGGYVEARKSGLWSKTDYLVRDMDKLFTNDRYIRLLCEYKTKGVKNTDHILWHIQTVYRDMSLIEGREPDHIKHLKSTLKDVTWPDGTNANDYIGDAAAAINELISQAVIPGKNSYAG